MKGSRKLSSWISAQTRRMRLSWTLSRRRSQTRRMAKQLERLKQELATLQVMASERVEQGKALERRLLPLLEGPPPERQEPPPPPPPQLVLGPREVTPPQVLPNQVPELMLEPEPMSPAELELAQRLGL